jgi:hypothetical protein
MLIKNLLDDKLSKIDVEKNGTEIVIAAEKDHIIGTKILQKLFSMFEGNPSNNITINTFLLDELYSNNLIEQALLFGRKTINQLDEIFIKANTGIEFINKNIIKKEVFAYSLFGRKAEYFIPLIESISQLNKFLPEAKVVVYYDETVPEHFIELLLINKVILIKKEKNIGLSGTFWRFEAVDDFPNDRIHIRDSDSIITRREISLLKLIIENNIKDYIIRDNPKHAYPILGGMWGISSIPKQPMKALLKRFPNKIERTNDQLFLGYFLWKWFKLNSIQIDRFYYLNFKKSKYFNPKNIEDILDERLHIGAKLGAALSLNDWLDKRIKLLKIETNEKIIKKLSEHNSKTIKESFTEIYLQNKWGIYDNQTISGVTSTFTYTENLRKELPIILDNLKINKIFDAPCGDFNWMSDFIVNNNKLKYFGVDIVEPLIQKLSEKYKKNSHLDFACMDITMDNYPEADLMICRDCLFHLSYNEIFKILMKFKDSKIKYFLTTSHINKGFINKDIDNGDFRKIDLFIEPFNFEQNYLYKISDGLDDRYLYLWTREQITDFIDNCKLS